MNLAAVSLAGLLLAVAPTASGPGPGAAPDPSVPERSVAARGVWPLKPQPAVVAGFDPPASRYGAGHRGVDLAGSPGQRVHAAVAGRVTYAGLLAGRGVVVVDHGATRTTYEPVRASVEVGALVDAGQPIGTLETSGSHCRPDPCLHWGLIEADTYLDPLRLVGAGPVRLLPLWSSSGGVDAQAAMTRDGGGTAAPALTGRRPH